MKRNADKPADHEDQNEENIRKPFSDWADADEIHAFPSKPSGRERDAIEARLRMREEERQRLRAEERQRSRQAVQDMGSTRAGELAQARVVAQTKPKRGKRVRASRVFLGISILLALLLIGTSMVWSYVTGKFMKEPEQTKPSPTIQITDESGSVHHVTPTPIPEKSAFAEGIKNILLIGSDSRDDGEHDLADVIMILTVDNNTKQLKLSSIQRDMLAYIGGDTAELKKINSALMHGPEMLIHTINENLSLDIQDYVEIDMSGTETIIDMLGGIEIDVPDDEGFLHYMNLAIYEQNVLAEGWTYNENYVDELDEGGLKLLSGRQTLAYMRVRKIDSDYRRTERQREVMELLLQKFMRQNPIKMAQVVREGLGFVRTDLSYGDIFSLATQVIPALNSGLEQLQIPITGSFWEDQAGNIVPSFKLMNPEIHQFVYGDLTHQLAVPQIPQSPAIYTDYYLEPGTDRFIEAYKPVMGLESASQASIEEYERQVANGYVHVEPPQGYVPIPEDGGAEQALP